MAEQMGIDTPTIDGILHWAQQIRKEQIIGEDNRLLIDSPDINKPFKTGIPTVYGISHLENCVD